MATQYVQIGEDAIIEITVVDSSGDAVNLSSYAGYAVILFEKESLNVVAKYSKNAVTGYTQDLDTTDEATGIIDINLKRSITDDGVADQDVHFMVLTQASNADFESSRFMALTDATYCFTWASSPETTLPDIS